MLKRLIMSFMTVLIPVLFLPVESFARITYRIRMTDSTYAAVLKGVALTRTADSTIVGTYSHQYNAHEFDIARSGYYRLWIDVLGGTDYVEDVNWRGAENQGRFISGNDWPEMLEFTDVLNRWTTGAISDKAITPTKITLKDLNTALEDSGLYKTPKYPFSQGAQLPDPCFEAIRDFKLSGTSDNENYYVQTLQYNDTLHRLQIVIFRTSDDTEVCAFRQNTYTPADSLEILTLSTTAAGVSGQVMVDWRAMPDNSANFTTLDEGQTLIDSRLIHPFAVAVPKWDGILDSKDVYGHPADSSVTIKMRDQGSDNNMFRMFKNSDASPGVLRGSVQFENYLDGVMQNYIDFKVNPAVGDAVTIWPRLNVEGDLWTVGNVNGYSMSNFSIRIIALEVISYGSIYTYSGTTATAIDSASAWRQVNTFTAAGEGAGVQIFTGTDDKITVLKAGKFVVNFSGSFTCGTTSNVEFMVYADATGKNALRRQVTLTAGVITPVSISGVVDLTITQNIRLYIKNVTGAHAVIMVDGNLAVNRMKI